MKEKENRTVKRSFRFTESEWSLIEKKCELADITPTQYFQQLALTGKTAKKDCLKEKQMYLGQVGMIGNNLNQIARKLNFNSKIELWMLHVLLKIEQHLNKGLLQ